MLIQSGPQKTIVINGGFMAENNMVTGLNKWL